MKQLFLRGALAVAVVLGGATAYAQMGGQGGGEVHGTRQPMSPDQRVQMMTQQLNLTNDQQQNIKLILEDESKQMESLRSDSSLSQQDRMSKMKEIRQSTSSQIKPLLTSDQQTKWQQMMDQRSTRPGATSQQRQPQPQ